MVLLNVEERKEYQRNYYLAHKDKFLPRNKVRMQGLRQEVRQRLNNIKSEKGCMICGETHPATLDFHHRDGTEKESGIAELASALANWDIIQTEIDKCDILCANCHRKLHWKN